MRDVTEAFIAELTAGSKAPILFYEGEFATGTVRMWTGFGTITWDSKTWTGAGNLGGVSDIQETGDVQANGVTLSLSGIPSEMIALALDDARQGLPGKIWLGFMAADGSVVADPDVVFAGRLDVPQVDDGATTCTISISYENRLRDLDRAREYRYTDESQKIFYPTDKGFEFVPSLQEWSGVWGKS